MAQIHFLCLIKAETEAVGVNCPEPRTITVRNQGHSLSGTKSNHILYRVNYREWHNTPNWSPITDHWPYYCIKWAAPSEFVTYRLCEQRRFRRACASAQSRQNLRCSLIQTVSQEEPSDRNPDPWPLWMAGHAQLKFVMTECSKTQIRLTGPK